MRFTKMHGIGNDYVYVDGFHETVADPAALAKVISNRHTGVGSDGLILVLPSNIADVRMRMFNADGSEAEMCGNGIRCVAKFAYDRGIARNNPMKVETARGVLTLELFVISDRVQRVTVNMGAPILDSAKIPTTIQSPRVLNQPLPDFGDLKAAPGWRLETELDPRMTCVSMGNPHVVMFCRNVERVPLERVGPLIENSPLFPRRINVHFVRVDSKSELTMRTWERGSGVTLACGTGACAVAVAANLTTRADRSTLIHLPGGDLSLDWRAEDNNVYMTGPAAEVFSGEWPEV
jgi:diaminopimelate epimerase